MTLPAPLSPEPFPRPEAAACRIEVVSPTGGPVLEEMAGARPAFVPKPAPAHIPDLEEVKRLNTKFETAEPVDVLRWAVETYSPRLVALSSFGASAGALLHMLAQVDHTVPVAFLQTHYHFEETLEFRDLLAEKYGLTVENWEARGGRPGFLRQFPDDLNKQPDLEGLEVPEAARASVKTGVDLCCWMNKVEPLQRALRNRLAYISSVRRDGGSEVRARTRVLEFHHPEGRPEPIVKINPMANWSKQQLWKYIHVNDVPYHPLFTQGFASIGCRPCTATSSVADERSGRWQGQGKQECGIHTYSQALNYDI